MRRALKYHRVGHFVRERLRDPRALKRAGYRFRTKPTGDHRVVMAFPSGPRRRGAGVVQAILHPLSEVGGPGGKFLCKHDACRRISEES